MKLIAEALMLGIGAVIAGYGVYSLRLMILWVWRKRRVRTYKNTRRSCSSDGR
ncbi:hypothetical protein [Christensenella minuta]|uniref:Uncharacterized protein n=1 Tax=Christensenella minuta TaxID=626937 RepID=A0A136Q824_9FIRM|nr:hypothetical protein [Christensenella minuta]KXK66831.1 hypothetical protein HMPREF3293_00303 [Christensenella minuta]